MTELGVLLSNVGIELEGDAANPRQAAFQIGIVGHPEVLLESDDNGAHSFPKALCASRASAALCLIETHRACDGRSQSCAQTVTKPAIAFTFIQTVTNCNKASDYLHRSIQSAKVQFTNFRFISVQFAFDGPCLPFVFNYLRESCDYSVNLTKLQQSNQLPSLP